MSANLPKGIRKIAAAKIYEVATQLKEMASSPNSFPNEGRATFIAETINGVRNADNVEIINAGF